MITFSRLVFLLIFLVAQACASRISNVVLPAQELTAVDGIHSFLGHRFADDQKLNPESVLMVAITRDGSTTYYRYGDSREFEKAYAIGSLSKTLTAALIAKLVHEGKLRYEDQVHGTSIRRLLTHTAGIKDFGADLDSLLAFCGFAWDGWDLYRRVDEHRMESEERICNEADFRYSSIGYALLQKYVEDRLQTPFAELLRREILDPLGMNQTLFDPNIQERADGYPGEYPLFMQRKSKIPLEFSSQNYRMLASAGYWSHLQDLVILVEHLRKRADFWADLQRPEVDEGEGKRATLGLTLETVNGIEIAYKRGLSYGHSVYIGYRDQVSVVVIRNSLRMTDEIGHSLLLGLVRSEPKSVSQSSKFIHSTSMLSDTKRRTAWTPPAAGSLQRKFIHTTKSIIPPAQTDPL